jgi:Ca-activated chloride channel homolog
VIGEGLAAALDVVEERWQREGRTDAALILLSDGLRTRVDSEHPVEVAARARELEIPIHTVVIGRPGTPDGPDIGLMRLVTDRSGGSLVTADSAEDLRSVYRNLGTQLSTDLSVPRQAALFITLAVGFAIAAAIVLFVRS